MGNILIENGKAVGALSSPISASNVIYDNSDSGLSATNVQDSIDELDSDIKIITLLNIDGLYIVASNGFVYINGMNVTINQNKTIIALNDYKPIGTNARTTAIDVDGNTAYLLQIPMNGDFRIEIYKNGQAVNVPYANFNIVYRYK